MQFLSMSDPADRLFVSEFLGVPTDGCTFGVAWGDRSWPDRIDLFAHARQTAKPLTFVRVGREYILQD